MTIRKTCLKLSVGAAFGLLMILAFLVFGSSTAEAKTFNITQPEQLVNINWKNAGYGPGHTYKIMNDMTLGDGDDSTCRLTKGNFVIDFNGHTVQNSHQSMTVFSVRGANVTFKDSKASKKHVSVRSYGVGAVEITAGKLTIRNGIYVGASNGQNNPCALHVGGGTCTVNGGVFAGDHIGADCMGGKLQINGGTFKTSYMFALMDFGGTIKITKGTFKNTKAGSFNPPFALGAYNTSGSYYDFSKWLASGSSFSPTLMSYYWNGTSTDPSPYPTKTVGTQYVQTGYTYPYAVAYTGNSGYEAVTIKVKTKAAPGAPKISSVSAGSRSLTVKWKKNKAKTTGYQVQYSTNSKFKNAKTVTVNSKSAGSCKLTGLSGGKKYYVRVRAYRKLNGTKLYSKWSKTKSKTAKR